MNQVNPQQFQKSNRTIKLVNIISIVVILISVSSWKFIFPKIFGKEKVSVVRVEGEASQANESNGSSQQEVDPSSSRSKLTYETLFNQIPDAPVKKEDAGQMYARARSAIAIDVDSGTILHYQDGKKRMAIASLTKLMTAILTVENIKDLDNEVVTIDQETVYQEGTVVGCPRTGYCVSNRLRIGEKISAMNLLKAMLMNSTNDAAMALGKHIGGSKEGFARIMNDKAKEMGLQDTHFCNPSGLDEDDKPGQCYSSAYDLARIAAYSMRYDIIWDIMKIKDHDIASVDNGIVHHIINTDLLLDQMPNCLGGKTGFTYEAGKSLMMAAHDPQNKNHRVVAVLLDDEYRWEDMKNLFSWIFSSFDWPK